MAKLAAIASLRKYNPDEPRVPAGNPDGGQWTGDSDDDDGDDGDDDSDDDSDDGAESDETGVQIAAVGDLECQGFAGGCQSGGSYGTSAMYRANGQNLCRSCAVKMLGLKDETGAEQSRILERYLILGD